MRPPRSLTRRHRRLLTGAAAVAVLAAGVTAAARGDAVVPSTDATHSYPVGADAYVRADAPGTNFGGRYDDQASSRPDVRTYVSVDVSGLSGTVVAATLQFTSYTGAAEGVDVSLAAGGWSESTVTYDNAPAVGPVIGHSGPLTGFGTVSVDVTSAVQGNGSYSFAVTSTRTSGVSHLGSSESGTPPQLVVLTAPDGSTPPPTTSPPAPTTPAPTTSAPDPTTPAPTTSAPDPTTPAPTTSAPDPTAPAPTTTAPATSAPPPASSGVPGFDHVVVVVMENKAYGDVMGNGAAPYVNQLAATGASFSHSYAITHPSEPNYLALFSGSTHGITDDSCPHSWSGPDLASTLADRSQSFRAYSEDLPSVGWTGCSTGLYARKHAPWVDFTDVPAAAARPFSDFPTDFGALPSVSFVVPNLVDDMHNAPVSTGDAWLSTHLGAYAAWARTHNSLLVVTWDEDDNSADNQIPTIVVGDHVRPGVYAERVDHYRVLRTVEDAFGATPVGASATTTAITDIWN